MDSPIEAPPPRWFFGDTHQRSLAWRYWVWETLNGLGHVAIHHTVRKLPIDTVSAIGEFAGRRISRHVMPDADRQAQENWARLRPDDAGRAASVAEYAFAQTGRLHWEFPLLERIRRDGRIAIHGGENVAAAHATGRPVLVTGFHLSNWEMIGPGLVTMGFPVTAIYQQPPNRFDHRLVVEARNEWGCILLPPGPSGARPAYRTLMEKERLLLIYIDECIDGYVYAPFFGRPLKLEGNITRAARLAAMTDAIVIPAYVTRDDGAHFHATYMPPVEMARSADRDADLAVNVARINDTIEPVIRAHLEQWFWLFDLRLEGSGRAAIGSPAG
jgi:KDO2-lipid IV(A) lauroyltransferase